MKKVNFVGGEPTLCPFLGELITFSKKLGLITGVVSNGTGITQQFLDQNSKYINWIGLSLDSGKKRTQQILGRGNGKYISKIMDKSKMIKQMGIKLKINSGITRLNVKEDISKVIDNIRPEE